MEIPNIFKLRAGAIQLSDLDDNFDIIKNLLSDGFIEDSNGYSNKYLKKIIESKNKKENNFKLKYFMAFDFINLKKVYQSLNL